MATNYLDKHQIAYDKIEVRGSQEAMTMLQKISGQTRTPTLVWDGKVLADFGTDQLEKFLSERSGKHKPQSPNGSG